MLCRAFVNTFAVISLISGLFPHAVIGTTFSRIEDASLEPPGTRLRTDLGSMLRRAPFHEARVFETARKHIQEIESSPACHQMATSALIDSCQSFSSMPGQDAARPADNSLDQVRQEYAARLAVCELQGIKSGIPTECAPFVPSRQACPRAITRGFFRKNASSREEPKRACYPDFTPHHLKQCVDTLFDHAQRWTSYSNAQTNAIVICQASRGAVENEEHLQKLQEAVQYQAMVSETLSRAVQETEDRLAQHHTFTEAARQFQNDLATRNEAALAQADNVVARLVEKFGSATEALLGVFTLSIKNANDKTHSLSDNIKAAHNEVDQARAALQELYQEAVLRDTERKAVQDLALRDNQAIASDVQASLENVRDVTVHGLAERLQGVEAVLAHYLHAQQQALGGQQAFQEIQTRIMANQVIIETSLASQHELIEEQSHKLTEMTFGGLGNTITTYVGLSLFVILLSRASLVLAAAAASGVGLFGIMGIAPLTNLFSLTTLTFTNLFDLINSASTNLFDLITSTTLIIAPFALRLVGYAAGIALLLYTFIVVCSFIRNLTIFCSASGSIPDIEVKREGALYDV